MDPKDSLRQLAKALTDAANPSSRFRLDMHRSMGEQALKQITEEFNSSRDPYGSAWLPSKKHQNKPLVNTGLLKNSFKMTPTTKGYTIENTAPGAASLNFGTNNTPRRQFLPDQSKGIGMWQNPIEDAVKASLKEIK